MFLLPPPISLQCQTKVFPLDTSAEAPGTLTAVELAEEPDQTVSGDDAWQLPDPQEQCAVTLQNSLHCGDMGGWEGREEDPVDGREELSGEGLGSGPHESSFNHL